ncbi:glycoside hydrolase [Paenibacillus sp. Cedars]|uniref:glycoside hydrolase family 38 N-terminal domain-containing protein n=1 Tax=Paenibacillus sp. Cedars TaxID=1980674 RepID=UPI001161F64A|nr:glycoside hydrolase [Paenibacillus sp. Cedars]AWP28599.1 glycoside hydrolase [Paenibacillus sp. Cedars]
MNLSNQGDPRPARPWTIYAIHHSHTDIGYTERQERIEQYHVDFIRQAVGIAEAAHRGERPDWSSFRWTCETFWAVEKFLEAASPEEKEAFQQAVIRGDIELSGTYLNMTELPDFDLLKRNHGKAQQYAKSIGHRIDSAMTADINGYGWGYADSLLQNNIEHLFSCIHTHHGMYPLGRKQTPFWWESPEGGKLLVWNGEHYMFGNELGFCPDALGKYIIKDEFQHNLMEPEHRHNNIASLRINRYLWNLEQESYPYSFVPIMVSGLGTDNASPNADIAEWMTSWNEQNGDRITIKLATLSEFFADLKQEDLSELPVHRGDWPDWWTDGVASTAMHTQIYRDAQRTLRKVKRLDPASEMVSPAEIDDAAQALTMYAEHTWGYHSSVYEPWHPQVQMLEVRKQAYAAEASKLAYRALDKALVARQGALLAPHRPLRYEVINTEPATATLQVAIPLDGWENVILKRKFELIDESNGQSLPYQLTHTGALAAELTLTPGESRTLSIHPLETAEVGSPSGNMVTARNTEPIACEGIADIRLEPLVPYPVIVGESFIESDSFRIEWEINTGITAWIDKTRSTDLLDDARRHGPFTPVYEVTPAQDEHSPSQICATRARMGRNRKGTHVQRDAGRLIRVNVLDNGPLFALIELVFEVKGLSYYALHIKLFANQPRAEVSVRFHKDSVWLPENVYVALPFSMGPEAELYVEKAGCHIRPWKDQIPGSCIDYTSAQEGIFWHSAQDREALAVSMTDTPLVQLGTLEHTPRQLHTMQSADSRPYTYAWILTNYWETNFKATLGGFYEFRYAVERHHGIDPQQAKEALHASTGQFTIHRIK